MSLTDDDKAWYQTHFELLGSHFGKLEARFDRLEAKVERLEGEMHTGFEQVEIKIEQVETRLLTTFHKWASPMEARQRAQNAAIRALDLEIESIADRLKAVEVKLERQKPDNPESLTA